MAQNYRRKRRDLRREAGERRYSRLFIIAVEGKKTEKEYFNHIKRNFHSIEITCLSSGQGSFNTSNPISVCNRLEEYLERNKEKIKQNKDEAWMVIDKDNWNKDDINLIYHRLKAKEEPCKCFLALSNPKFEYWLLLHFEDGNDINKPGHCDCRLRNHLPNYKKSIDQNCANKLFKNNIINTLNEAIVRAKKRDNPPCEDWPKQLGCTTVYKLIENIVSSNNQ